METQRMRIHLRAGLESLEIRRALGVLEAWQYWEENVAGLGEAALQILAEFLERSAARPGVYGSLSKARLDYIRYCLSEERRRNGKHDRATSHRAREG